MPYEKRNQFAAYSITYSLYPLDMYGLEDGGIPATFFVLYMIGWKPHDSQVRKIYIIFVDLDISINSTLCVGISLIKNLICGTAIKNDNFTVFFGGLFIL